MALSRSRWRLLGNALCALLAFALASGAVRALRPWPENYGPTVKLRHLAEHGDRYDLLYVGSSLVLRHFVPSLVDARLAERGRASRGFNLGGPMTRGFEADHLLRTALALEGVSPEVVVIEPSEWSPEFFGPNAFTSRSVEWHTPRQSWRAARSAWGQERWTLTKRLETASLHLRLGCWWLSSYGQGGRIARFHLFGEDPQPITPAEVEAGAGYQALEGLEEPSILARRAKLLTDPGAYHEKIRKLRAEAGRKVGLGSFDPRLVEAQVEEVRAVGAEPLYVVPPSSVATPRMHTLHARGILPSLFAFNDPDRYPELYLVERHFDLNHLDREGALLFSALFADRLADWLEARP